MNMCLEPYDARYLDPKTSRWISADPAMGDYIPGAPINDEVRKRNVNLPGMGGVFNVVNLHTYHYAGNNPLKYMDPDGEKIVNITSKQQQNSRVNAPLPLGNNNKENAFGKSGCFFTAVMNVGNTINKNKSGDNRTFKGIEGFSNNTKYFQEDKETKFLENLDAKGVSSLLTDLTGESFNVVKFGGNAGGDPLTALDFFDNSSDDYFIIADVGSSHFVNVLGTGSNDSLSVHDTNNRHMNSDGITPNTREPLKYSRGDIKSIYVIRKLDYINE